VGCVDVQVCGIVLMTLEHLAHHIPVSFAPISGVLHLTIAVAGQSNYCVDASFLRIRIGHENSPKTP
jgi:hypothetical protein